MSEEQTANQAENMPDISTGTPAPTDKPKKKASWLRTILWMVSMMVLFNIIAGILVYIFMPPIK